MNSFHKLIETKRKKMLMLVSLLTIFGLINYSTSINLTYIVRKDENKSYPSCIAEENTRYSGMGWIYPISTVTQKSALPNITTKFIPNLTNEYNCKFSKNSKCNLIWTIKNWQIDGNSSRTFDLIHDERWDDFPTIFTSNATKEFEERVEIVNVFRIGFSLRGSSGELLICEGWDPHKYACYHLALGESEIFLRKYAKFPKIMSANDSIVDSYKVYSNILSDDEWRNFIVSLNKTGTLQLIDVNVNRTVIEFHDQQPLRPLFILPRSNSPALWKIHHNQFIYTELSQISRLGPTFILPSKELCVALYVSTCPTCAMDFIIMKDNERKILEKVQPTKAGEWKLVKLKDENILTERVSIFVETKYVDGAADNRSAAFWAVDDVRVCHENEVKVSFLKRTNEREGVDGISCQVVDQPKWRPKQLDYDKIKDFPLIVTTSSPDSIMLSWSQEDPENQISYFITFKANDICTSEPHNLRRIKSNGFLITKHNEMNIENLIPYTHYNISFSSVLHENDRELFLNTLETAQPTPEELPNKIQVVVTDSKAYISWENVSCLSNYGHIMYSMNLTNTMTKITSEFNHQTENSIQLNNLDPFTRYSLNILTSRNADFSKSIPMTVNFTTRSGVAPALNNLEVYSADESSFSIRYDLPNDTRGIPTYVQVTRCNSLLFKKCKTSISLIARCALFHNRYCVDINNLIPYQRHILKVSIKNDHTNTFGEERKIDAFTEDKVPGAPIKLRYRIEDCRDGLEYCHLNITWTHPYDQNGTITAFNIVLNGTSAGANETIQEVLKIVNKTYSPIYNYQIKYIPYSAHYELYVQSVNTKYKSKLANIHVRTDNIGDHIDQSPKLLGMSDKCVIFKVPPVDSRLQSYKITVLIQDYDKDVPIRSDLLTNTKIADHLCHNFGNSWFLNTIDVTNSTGNITIGSGHESNRHLKPQTKYCLTFIVTNKYKNQEHDVVYYEKLETSPAGIIEPPKTGSSFGHLYVLLVLLILVPVGFLLYKRFRTRRPAPKNQPNNENVYESLPFEECEENNCVNNETYDQLLHK